ncbi:MAG: hypothetical protein H7Z41_19990 [Cytophagales bacterium]|nr:hypothetical protein [Armatimonadota bacterium]
MSFRSSFTTIAALCAVSAAAGVAAFSQAERPALAEPPSAPVASATTAVRGTIDESALAILKKAETQMLGLKSYQAECWTSVVVDPKPDGTPRRSLYSMATLTAVKPNLMRYDRWSGMAAKSIDPPSSQWKRKSEKPDTTYVCDGKTVWRQYGTTCSASKRTDPTQYIIDAKGIIRNSSVGYDGPTHALEKSVREALKTNP